MFKIGEKVIYTTNISITNKVYNSIEPKKAVIVDYDKEYNKYQIELLNTITTNNQKIYMWVSPNTLDIDYLYNINKIETTDDITDVDEDILNELLNYYVSKEDYIICSKIKKALCK